VPVCIYFFTGAPGHTQTGKIAGRVIDSETREGLPGANVSIEGSNHGASSDAQGNYVIINVAPGIYTLKSSFIGYAAVVMTDVRVSIDLTTAVDFESAGCRWFAVHHQQSRYSGRRCFS
jgi:hypothetical protein